MSEVKFILITTFFNKEIADKYIFKSLFNVIGKDKIGIIIINQLNITQEYNLELGFLKEILTEQSSLSSARNIGLKYLYGSNLKPDYIFFPDDDNYYPPNFFIDIINKKINNSFIFKSLNIEDYLPQKEYSVTNVNNINNVNGHVLSISGAFALKYEDIKDDFYFDENLGVGAKYGSSEDVDLYFYIINKKNFVFQEDFFIYHPSNFIKLSNMPLIKLIKRNLSYSLGFYYVLKKHNVYSQAYVMPFRSLGGGVYSLLKLNLKLSIAYFITFMYRIYLLFNLLIIKKI